MKTSHNFSLINKIIVKACKEFRMCAIEQCALLHFNSFTSKLGLKYSDTCDDVLLVIKEVLWALRVACHWAVMYQSGRPVWKSLQHSHFCLYSLQHTMSNGTASRATQGSCYKFWSLWLEISLEPPSHTHTPVYSNTPWGAPERLLAHRMVHVVPT